MFSAPTAVRVLKKQPPEFMKTHDVSSLKTLYLAGEPLDETTSQWISSALGVPVVDNYWQTETGWPILSIAKGVDDKPTRLGSPGVPMYGYKVKLLNEATGQVCGTNEKGVVAIEGPLPPGCMQTVYGDDERFVKTYWSNFDTEQVYSTFDWGMRDADGYYFILGRTDDVINVAGHRLSTGAIEEVLAAHPDVAECAVVGLDDALKGQVPLGLLVLKAGVVRAGEDIIGEVVAQVRETMGAVVAFKVAVIVPRLPKTRSGKVLRGTIASIANGCAYTQPATIEDPAALDDVRQALCAAAIGAAARSGDTGDTP
jgi:propionyl-CoA synthetase